MPFSPSYAFLRGRRIAVAEGRVHRHTWASCGDAGVTLCLCRFYVCRGCAVTGQTTAQQPPATQAARAATGAQDPDHDAMLNVTGHLTGAALSSNIRRLDERIASETDSAAVAQLKRQRDADSQAR